MLLICVFQTRTHKIHNNEVLWPQKAFVFSSFGAAEIVYGNQSLILF